MCSRPYLACLFSPLHQLLPKLVCVCHLEDCGQGSLVRVSGSNMLLTFAARSLLCGANHLRIYLEMLLRATIRPHQLCIGVNSTRLAWLCQNPSGTIVELRSWLLGLTLATAGIAPKCDVELLLVQLPLNSRFPSRLLHC